MYVYVSLEEEEEHIPKASTCNRLKRERNIKEESCTYVM
jgi:hypothetical protein